MRVECTAVADVGTAPFDPVELSVWLPEPIQDAPALGEPLRAALAAWWPGRSFTIAGRDVGQLRPGVAPFVDGAVIVVHEPGPARPAEDGRPPEPTVRALFTVCAGPAAGTVFALRRGHYGIGRGPGGLQIVDPALSRRHGSLTVGERTVTVVAARGSPGFQRVRGWSRQPTASAVPMRGRFTLEAGDLLLCGASTCRLVLPLPACGAFPAGPAERACAGSGYFSGPDLAPLPVTAPASLRGRKALLVAGAVPLVLGLVLAWLTASLMFLAFAAMGAVSLLVPVLGGSAQRRRFAGECAAAAAEDARRRHARYPGADDLLLAASGLLPGPDRPGGAAAAEPGGAGAGLALRLGLAWQQAGLEPSPAVPGFHPPTVPRLPLTVPLGASPVTVRGPVAALEAFLAFALMQVDAAGAAAIVLGTSSRVPPAARFLPQTRVLASPAAVQQAAAEASAAVLLCWGPAPPELLAACPGVSCVSFVARPPGAPGPDAALRLSAGPDDGPGTAPGRDFIPDGVPAGVFERYARARAGSAARSAPRRLAADAATLAGTPAAIGAGWWARRGAPLTPVPVGTAPDGPVLFDFRHDGPHLLVGGTTGSGKSELLRTVVGAVAWLHSPADVQFLLLDFKGGAGLGPLHGLPHTTALVTDLEGQGMERVLVSLRAEMYRREALLRGAAVPDADAFRRREHASPGHGMAHLLLVVDEFRILVEQFPAAMAELMRLAAIGRSLGIHLVLATQRPQGAISAEIRANVTSSICLRVQSVHESQDVIGSGVAATIGVDTPGRAFLRRAGEAPREFQCRALQLPAAVDRRVLVQRAEEVLRGAGPSPAPPAPADGEAGDGAVAAVAALLTAAWRELSTRQQVAAAAPILARELPARLSPASVRGDAVEVGILDVPERQQLCPLRWDPQQHAHVACLGVPSSASPVVRVFVEQLLARNGRRDPAEQHFAYLLDGDGSLARCSGHHQVGCYLTPATLRTVHHLLLRLLEETRRAPLPLTLAITDWGRWATALRASPWAGAEDSLNELCRRGHLTVVIGGERELLLAPFLAAISNRLYLPLGSSPESRMLWPALPPLPHRPGRAGVTGAINALASGEQADHPHAAQLAVGPRTAIVPPRTEGARPPLVVRELPRALSMADVAGRLADAAPGSSPGPRAIVVGLGGDGDMPVWLPLAAGSVLPVLGGPGAGKSSFLTALQTLARQRDAASGLLWVDDAAELTAVRQRELTEELAAGAALILTVPAQPTALARLPLEWGLRQPSRGIVLRPRHSHDGELFGVRLLTDGDEPPGRAVLIEQGRCRWFQFPG